MPKRSNAELEAEEPPAKKPTAPAVDLHAGTVLTDILGKKWRLGKSVGTGGFGMIYLASDDVGRDVPPDARYVAKVESHTSGPLFVERNCYLLIAKPEMIHQWKKEHKLQHLGMPHYVASGSHSAFGNRYRFLIIPRFEKDLEEVFKEKKHKFNLKTVLTIALQTIDVLQYIHSKGYVHSDIKASNIMLDVQKAKPRTTTMASPKSRAFRYYGCTPMRLCKIRKMYVTRLLRPNMGLRYFNDDDEMNSSSEYAPKMKSNNIDKIYLLDYGLASKYLTTHGKHKEFCSDMRKAHAGTIAFCSRDAHEGAQSRRSDLECLGYNLIYWLTSSLPWSKDFEDPERVHKKKIRCIENLKVFLNYCFSDQCPQFLFDYFNYLQNLKFEQQPDYNYCKSLFRNALHEYGYKNNLQLDFENLEGWGHKQKKLKCNSENAKIIQTSLLRFKRSPLKSNLPLKSPPPPKPMLRRKTNKKLRCKTKWLKLLDPETIIKQAKSKERKMTESSDSSLNLLTPMTLAELNQLNPTAAMREIFHKARERQSNTNGTSPRYRGDNNPLVSIEGYTPAMLEVYNRKKEAEEIELAHSRLCVRSNGRAQARSKNVGRLRKTPSGKARSRPSPPRKPKPDARKEPLKQAKPLRIRETYSLRG